MSQFAKCYFILIILFLPSVTRAGEVPEEFVVQEWLEENIPELDEEQRTAIANSLLSIVDEFGSSLSDDQRAAILRELPPYLGEIRSTKEYGQELATELLQERYRCAIRDYVERPDVTEEEQQQIDSQRDEVFAVIREEATKLVENAPSDEASENLWNLLDSLEERMREQSRNPLSPYFKHLLDPSEFNAWLTGIREEFSEYASLPEPPAGRPMMLEDGIPVEWIDVIQESYGGDRFTETESPELRDLMKRHMEASEAKMVEEERKNIKAWRERVEQSQLRSQVSMAASELERKLSEDRASVEVPAPQESAVAPASITSRSPPEEAPAPPNRLLPLALAGGAVALLCAMTLGMWRVRYRNRPHTGSTGGHS